MSAPELDYSRQELEHIDVALAEIQHTWEHSRPQETSSALSVLSSRLRSLRSSSPDVRGLQARVLAQLADAQAAAHRTAAAALSASNARTAAQEVGDVVTDAAAEMLEGELLATFAPGQEGVEKLAHAAARAAGTPTGVQAATLHANAVARQGDPAEVVRILQGAESVQGRLGDADGHWTPGHLYAFGGSALVRAGAHELATQWLTTADSLLADQPRTGIRAATTLYWGHLAARHGEWDAAWSYASTAVEAAPGDLHQVLPMWLTTGIASIATQAQGRGGDWYRLRARMGV